MIKNETWNVYSCRNGEFCINPCQIYTFFLMQIENMKEHKLPNWVFEV